VGRGNRHSNGRIDHLGGAGAGNDVARGSFVEWQTGRAVRDRRDRACASVSTHPSSVALAEALRRLPGRPLTGLERTTRTQRGPGTAPFLDKGDDWRDETAL